MSQRWFIAARTIPTSKRPCQCPRDGSLLLEPSPSSSPILLIYCTGFTNRQQKALSMSQGWFDCCQTITTFSSAPPDIQDLFIGGKRPCQNPRVGVHHCKNHHHLFLRSSWYTELINRRHKALSKSQGWGSSLQEPSPPFPQLLLIYRTY